MTHPLGPAVDRHLAHKKASEAFACQFMAENQAELDKCTRGDDCPASLHYPACVLH